MTSRTFSAAIAALLLTAALAGCSGTPEGEGTPTPSETTPVVEPSVAPVDTPAPAATSGTPTCETIISVGTVKALTDAGWTAEKRDFTIGDITLNEGLLCLWADYTVVSDHGQLYGWSPITADEASKAQTWLLAQGWIREDGDDGSYFTEDPQFSLGTDEEGYGMTYFFGDGWVKLSDTKQGLILIDWAG